MDRSDEDLRIYSPLIMDTASKSSISEGKFFSSWFSKGKRKKNRSPECLSIECNLSNNISSASIKPTEKCIKVPREDENKSTASFSIKELTTMENEGSREDVKHESSVST